MVDPSATAGLGGLALAGWFGGQWIVGWLRRRRLARIRGMSEEEFQRQLEEERAKYRASRARNVTPPLPPGVGTPITNERDWTMAGGRLVRRSTLPPPT